MKIWALSTSLWAYYIVLCQSSLVTNETSPPITIGSIHNNTSTTEKPFKPSKQLYTQILPLPSARTEGLQKNDKLYEQLVTLASVPEPEIQNEQMEHKKILYEFPRGFDYDEETRYLKAEIHSEKETSNKLADISDQTVSVFANTEPFLYIPEEEPTSDVPRKVNNRRKKIHYHQHKHLHEHEHEQDHHLKRRQELVHTHEYSHQDGNVHDHQSELEDQEDSRDYEHQNFHHLGENHNQDHWLHQKHDHQEKQSPNHNHKGDHSHKHARHRDYKRKPLHHKIYVKKYYNH